MALSDQSMVTLAAGRRGDGELWGIIHEVESVGTCHVDRCRASRRGLRDDREGDHADGRDRHARSTGSKCALNSSAIGSIQIVTPANVSLQKGSEAISVRCSKECYQDGVGTIASNTEAMAAGNIVAGGIIGLGVDAATGAMNKYTDQNQITMVPIQGCRAKA